ncbi:MAG: helix-turn-helix domain-containing protein, partial [Ornithinimicrobium sp.]
MVRLSTRERLQDIGLALIINEGYESVTVEQIARAAGVSHMTFFRHFPTKQSLVLQDPFDPEIAAAVAAQPRDLTALARACGGFGRHWMRWLCRRPRVCRPHDRLVLRFGDPSRRRDARRAGPCHGDGRADRPPRPHRYSLRERRSWLSGGVRWTDRA